MKVNKKQLSAIVLSGLVALAITGCSSTPTVNNNANNGQQTNTETSEVTQKTDTNDKATATLMRSPEEELASPTELVIVDSGWFTSENGMVDFAVEVQNTNSTMEAVSPVIHAVAKDKDNNVIFEKDVDVPSVLPDSTYYFSMVTGTNNGPSIPGQEAVVEPASMEFTIETPDDAWLQTDTTIGDIYTINAGDIKDTDFGAKEFTGTVTATENVDNTNQTRVDVILFDDSGHIEGGYFKIVETQPNVATDYDVYAIETPDFSSYQVYASPWIDE